MSRPLHACIDLGALQHNLSVVRRHTGASRLWAVIKANGYGHGALRMASALAGQADGFGLIELETALALRAADIREPILMMEGCYDCTELTVFADNCLTPVLHSLRQVEGFVAATLEACLPVYLKLNTGMNRLGLTPEELVEARRLLAACPHAGMVTLMTHFADADEPRGVADQLAVFRTLAADHRGPVSLANSAALLRFPETCAGDSWARPGIMLYGSSPFPAMQSAAALGLRPVMTLHSELLAVRELQPGDRVGYGGNFVAERPMRIGIVAGGYGDGYPRHAPTGTPVLVVGQRTRTLGRVSMDKICVDLTGIDAATVGSPVVLWGEGLPADDVATAAGTVSYELFCALAGRVPVSEVE